MREAAGLPARVLLNIQNQYDLAPPHRRRPPERFSLARRRRPSGP